METFGKNLRYYRKQRGLTQTELAARAGVASAYVSQIESSDRVPSLRVARKFAGVLKVDLPVLLGNPRADGAGGKLSDSQKLELLRALIRSVQYDQDHRPERGDLECYEGSRGIQIVRDASCAVRVYLFPEGAREGAPETFHVHPGQEVLYCACGKVCLYVGGQRRMLAPGEVVTFDSSLPHAVRAAGAATAVSTVSPPPSEETYREHTAAESPSRATRREREPG